MTHQTTTPPTKKHYVHTIFSAVAKRYDLLNSLLSLRRDKHWRKFTVAASGPTPDASVLDVCTGTGKLALAYAHKLGKPVVGADFCWEMLAVGREKHGEHVDFMQADTLSLPFADNSFDVVSVGFGIRNVESLEKGLSEMLRVTAPGGRVAILEFTQPTNPIFRWIYYLYFFRVLPWMGNRISGNTHDAYGYLPESVLQFPDRHELKRIMESRGMHDVRFHTRTFGIVAVHVGQKG